MHSHHSRRFSFFVLSSLILIFVFAAALPGFAAPADSSKPLAATPPMGWNDWAHYQCDFTAQTILDNAKALVKTGLAADGYNTVTIDDCWMQKTRDANGNLQADPGRFPKGMRSVAQAVHALGLKFGIYEDSGYMTCGGFAGSGVPKGGGQDHFLQDARLFASWGVDYLKLDGCYLYRPKGSSDVAVYRSAYAAEAAALKAVGRPTVFSESAPAYFQGVPAWYDVLSWVGGYGQLWREGSDINTFDPKKADDPRFNSVLWNYAYNLPLGRFQKPGNWNDADFIIGGDRGMTLAESRSQITLWSMMSAPLILSSDLERLSPEAIAILGNRDVLAIDQDRLGRTATLVRRGSDRDVLFKPLSGGDYAAAVLNRGAMPIRISLKPSDFGFADNANCRLDASNLWSGTHESAASTLDAHVAAHDIAIWRIHPASVCRMPTHTGAITMIAQDVPIDTGSDEHRHIETYTHCLAAPGRVEVCAGTSAESWTVTADGALESGGRCLAVDGGKVVMQACGAGKSQHWDYSLVGNVKDAKGECLTAAGMPGNAARLSVQSCGHNRPDQIWSLPN